jgi:hypothetical protein
MEAVVSLITYNLRTITSPESDILAQIQRISLFPLPRPIHPRNFHSNASIVWHRHRLYAVKYLRHPNSSPQLTRIFDYDWICDEVDIVSVTKVTITAFWKLLTVTSMIINNNPLARTRRDALLLPCVVKTFSCGLLLHLEVALVHQMNELRERVFQRTI